MSLSPTHFVLMLIASVVVTPPLVLLIPHARQSKAFDRLLWSGTLLTAFLGTWLGIANWSNAWPDPSVNDVPVLPILAGAFGGAFTLNALLWILDRMERPIGPDDEPGIGDEFKDEPPPDAGGEAVPNSNEENETEAAGALEHK